MPADRMTERADVLPAVRAGEAGYLYKVVDKDVDPQALVEAIRVVGDGQVLLAPEAAEAVPRAERSTGDGRGIQTLTDREREVLVQIAHGRSNRETAHVLVVWEKTVKTHASSVFLKLGVQGRTQAALSAVRHGLAESPTPHTGTSSKSV